MSPNSNMVSLFTRATDPNQYDRDELSGWTETETSITGAGSRATHWERLRSLVGDGWVGARMLDYGAGTGWLLPEAMRLGARRAVGVDPSIRSVRAGRRHQPARDLRHGCLDALDAGETFDLVCAVLSLCHVADLDGFFHDLARKLRPEATVALLVPYATDRRHAGEVARTTVDGGYAVVRRYRELEVVDLVRSPESFVRAAARVGFVPRRVTRFSASTVGLLLAR
ncbi:class I SAM-dependent methyltransferase [Saccharopolyspora sp. 5N708]|uniref:class I SAM-dependent methyltransferase n=1 Tax=Saccharopolyspora sp. 5N708 TaxID=3457424 RepID=UPI003FD29C31